jgi:hypothetical protein
VSVVPAGGPRRSRWLLLPTLAVVVAAGVGLTVARSPWRTPSMEVEHLYQRCPVPSSPSRSPSPTPSGTGPLVPVAPYRVVQLCRPGQPTTESFFLDEEDATELVTRLNALPPTPECGGSPAGPAHLLVLREGADSVVVGLEALPCNAVRHGGRVRYGAAEIHDLAATIIERSR